MAPQVNEPVLWKLRKRLARTGFFVAARFEAFEKVIASREDPAGRQKGTKTMTSTNEASRTPRAVGIESAESSAQKRTIAAQEKKGLTVQDLILIAVLLAAGAVLKLTVASFLSFAGMKPNFVIAMYCLAIILARPNVGQALIIGLLAGLMCQIPMLNATPLVNIPSEVLGALACGLLIHLPLKVAGRADINPFVNTFLSTVVSGYTFAIIVGLMNGLELPVIFVTYAVMVFGTALFNAVLVQILTPLLRKVLKK